MTPATKSSIAVLSPRLGWTRSLSTSKFRYHASADAPSKSHSVTNPRFSVSIPPIASLWPCVSKYSPADRTVASGAAGSGNGMMGLIPVSIVVLPTTAAFEHCHVHCPRSKSRVQSRLGILAARETR